MRSPLLALYPRPVRDRWGPDLEAELRTAGWRGLPNTLAGIADLWLHPAIWPDASPHRRRLRLTTMTVAIALTCGFISMITAELGDRAARSAGHGPLMTTGMCLLLAGLLLLAPGVRAFVATCRIAVTRLAAPAALGAVVLVAVHGGAGGAPPGVRAAVVTCWWAALALGAVQTCRAIAAAGAHLAPPNPGRLRVGTAVLIAGAAANAAALLAHAPDHNLPGVGLLGLLATLVVALRDTRHLAWQRERARPIGRARSVLRSIRRGRTGRAP
jgi:hypothetical protein